MCRVVEVGKLAVLGSELLHRPSCVEDVLLPGLDKRGSLGVPIPGDDISQASVHCPECENELAFDGFSIRGHSISHHSTKGGEVLPRGHCSHQLTATTVPQRRARRTATNARVRDVRKAHVPGVAERTAAPRLFPFKFFMEESKTDTMEAPKVDISKAGSATRII